MTSLRRSAVLACAAVLVSTIAVVAPVSAATLTMYWQLPGGKQYVIGVDHVLSNGSSPGGYEKVYEYPTSLYNNNTVLPNPVSVSTGTGVTQVRFEFYQAPLGQSWDPNDGDGATRKE